MATIQLGNTKVANKLISYAEKRAEERSGVNCPPEYAKSQMTATRELWGKPDGVQAHHVIQSFKPGEVTAKEANEIGRDLAQNISKGHEAVVYTHTDKDHIHNHIVINSVNFENGSKYQSSKKDLHRIREESDRLCKERGLSIVEKKDSPVRYTLAEKALIEKGKPSWKEDIRTKVEQVKNDSKSYSEFKDNLLKRHNIEVRERGKTTTYYDHANNKRVRDNKLGADYERERIKDGFERSVTNERTDNGENGRDNGIPTGERAGKVTGDGSRSDNGERAAVSDSERTRTTNEIESSRRVSIDSTSRSGSERDDVPAGNRQPSTDQQGVRGTDKFDYEEFNRKLEQAKQGTRRAYQQNKRTTQGIDKSVLKATERESASDLRPNERDAEQSFESIGIKPKENKRPVERNEQNSQPEHKRTTERVERDTDQQRSDDRERNERTEEQARTPIRRNVDDSKERDFER